MKIKICYAATSLIIFLIKYNKIFDKILYYYISNFDYATRFSSIKLHKKERLN